MQGPAAHLEDEGLRLQMQPSSCSTPPPGHTWAVDRSDGVLSMAPGDRPWLNQNPWVLQGQSPQPPGCCRVSGNPLVQHRDVHVQANSPGTPGENLAGFQSLI